MTRDRKDPPGVVSLGLTTQCGFHAEQRELIMCEPDERVDDYAAFEALDKDSDNFLRSAVSATGRRRRLLRTTEKGLRL